MRIFYLCPDCSFPSGGIKRLYAHVEILREGGFDAYIMHTNKDFKLCWFENDVPIVYDADSHRFGSDDVIVIPESSPAVMKKLLPFSGKRVIISLSFAYIFKSMPPGENWKNYGINWVMANNENMAEFIRWSMNIENVHVIGSSIDHDLFKYNPDIKRDRIAYLKRKDMLSTVIEKIVKSRDTSSRKVNFAAIENLDVEEYAQILRESKIYLTTSVLEGFPRPILEAMACGCLCIGFDSVGGKDFIIDSGGKQNFVLAESMNIVDLSKKLAELIEKVRSNDPCLKTIRQNALSTAAGFTSELEKKSVLKFWKLFFESEC